MTERGTRQDQSRKDDRGAWLQHSGEGQQKVERGSQIKGRGESFSILGGMTQYNVAEETKTQPTNQKVWQAGRNAYSVGDPKTITESNTGLLGARQGGSIHRAVKGRREYFSILGKVTQWPNDQKGSVTKEFQCSQTRKVARGYPERARDRSQKERR